VHQPRLPHRAAAFRVEYRTLPRLRQLARSALILRWRIAARRLLCSSSRDFHEIDGLEALVRTCVRRFEVTALVVVNLGFEGLTFVGFRCIRDAATGRSAASTLA